MLLLLVDDFGLPHHATLGFGFLLLSVVLFERHVLHLDQWLGGELRELAAVVLELALLGRIWHHDLFS